MLLNSYRFFQPQGYTLSEVSMAGVTDTTMAYSSSYSFPEGPAAGLPGLRDTGAEETNDPRSSDKLSSNSTTHRSSRSFSAAHHQNTYWGR